MATLNVVGQWTSDSFAGLFNVEKKATPAGAAPNDQFGRSVAIDGNTAIVGAWQFQFFGSGKPGFASIIEVATGDELLKLTASDSAADDAFGISVGLSGNTAIVGASLDDDAGNSSGSAYLFDVANGRELFKLTAADAVADDQFGWATAISDNNALIGAPYNDHAGIDSGAAYLFDVPTGLQRYKLTASDASVGDEFGRAVEIDGDIAIVGAHAHDNGSGAAYLFDVTNGSELIKLTVSDADFEPHFGSSVSISGSRAIVGAPGDDGAGISSGAAYVFDVATGTELYRLTASDASGYSYFGHDVSIYGNVAVVGAWGDTFRFGAAYIFDLTNGNELLKLTAPDRDLNDRFGEFVGIDGNAVIASVRLDDDHGNASGSVYLFTPEPSGALLLTLGLFLLGLSSGRWSSSIRFLVA